MAFAAPQQTGAEFSRHAALRRHGPVAGREHRAVAAAAFKRPEIARAVSTVGQAGIHIGFNRLQGRGRASGQGQSRYDISHISKIQPKVVLSKQ
jgi:hypothetical protein